MKILVPIDGFESALDTVRCALHLQPAGLQARKHDAADFAQ